MNEECYRKCMEKCMIASYMTTTTDMSLESLKNTICHFLCLQECRE